MTLLWPLPKKTYIVSIQIHHWSMTDAIIRLLCMREKKYNNNRSISVIRGCSPALYPSQVSTAIVIRVLKIASDFCPQFLGLLAVRLIPLTLLCSRCKTIWLMLKHYVSRLEAPVDVNMTLMVVTVYICRGVQILL